LASNLPDLKQGIHRGVNAVCENRSKQKEKYEGIVLRMKIKQQ